MHKSRVCYVAVDCQDLQSQARFWAAALGSEVDDINANSAAIYARLKPTVNGLALLFQRVPEP